MKLFKVMNILIAVVLLSACKLEVSSVVEDDEEREPVEYIFYKSEMVESVFPSSDEYDLTITGASNKLDIEGNVRVLSITNDDNQLDMLDADFVDVMSLSASGTIINAVEIHVKEIKIAGDGNVITVADCGSLLLAGQDNQVISMAEGSCDQVGLLN